MSPFICHSPFIKRQNYGDRVYTSGSKGWGVQGRCDYKEAAYGQFGGSQGDRTTLYPACGKNYINLHMLTFLQLYTKKEGLLLYH